MKKLFILFQLILFTFSLFAQPKKETSFPRYDTFKIPAERKLTIPFKSQSNAKAKSSSTRRLSYSPTFDSLLARRLKNVLDAKRISNNTIGASAAIIIPGQGEWLGASGLSNPVTNDSISLEHLFGIGSISKSFCAALILKLEEEGLLSIEDSLNKFLPHFPNIDDYTIRLRHSLQMTSGVFDYFNDGPAAVNAVFGNPYRYWSASEICSTFVGAPLFSPGQGWSYSNTNYLLLGMIVNHLRGTNYTTQLHSRIFSPLNMNHTFFAIEDSLAGDIAHEWADVNGDGILDDYFGTYPRTAFYSMAYSAGAIFSTAEDLLHWGKALFAGQILNQTSMQKMLTFHPTSGYGLGVYRITALGKELWGHNGGTLGYISNMFYNPQDSVTIVLLTNQEGNPDPIWLALLDEVLKFENQLPTITVSPSPISFPGIDVNTAERETTFTITNTSYVNDTISLSFNYRNVVPESAISISHTNVVLFPDSSLTVTFKVRPRLLAPNILYIPQVAVKSKNGSDTVSVSNTVRFRITGTLGVKEEAIAKAFLLEQNYPNPFNPSTAIGFSLLAVGNVSLKVYNLLGEEVATLIHNRLMDEGKHEVQFDGSQLQSGIYFYKLTVGNYSATRKLLLMK
ncbi:MAG: serine hydrolase [Ignavibacteriales bacterium]|nr:serine hydrolase [Ignavibacteriales bacterium]